MQDRESAVTAEPAVLDDGTRLLRLLRMAKAPVQTAVRGAPEPIRPREEGPPFGPTALLEAIASEERYLLFPETTRDDLSVNDPFGC